MTNGFFSVLPHIDGGSILIDRRFNREEKSIRLKKEELALLIGADGPTSKRSLIDKASSRHQNNRVNWESLFSKLKKMEGIAEIGEKVLTLPLLSKEIKKSKEV
jgi:hypothetical protein